VAFELKSLTEVVRYRTFHPETAEVFASKSLQVLNARRRLTISTYKRLTMVRSFVLLAGKFYSSLERLRNTLNLVFVRRTLL
jgi:hypothetical protein